MAEPFEFSEIQAEHILDMTLSRLTRLGRSELDEELARLRATIAELEAILADESRLREVIKDELVEIKERFANERRSEITLDHGDLDIEDLIHDEELVVTLSAKGYVKTVTADSFRTQGRGGKGVAGARLRDDDYVTHILHTTAHAYLLVLLQPGPGLPAQGPRDPEEGPHGPGHGHRQPAPAAAGERIQAIIDTRDYETNRFLFFATRQGQVKKTQVQRVRLVAAQRPDRHQPARRRRAGEGDPDQRWRRHPHGVEAGAGHPIQRGRRAAHGPGGGGCARDEAALRRRGRVARHLPATTWPF